MWIYDLSGASSMRRLTVQGRNRYPIWSADGERVAFQSDREGDVAIFWQRADGTGPPNASPGQSLGLHFPESWSPQGGFLFSVFRASGTCSCLWTFSLRDRKAEPFGGVQLSTANLARSVFSPDGRWVAYMSDETGMTAVYVQPVPATGAKYPISKVGPPLPCGCRMERESFTLIRKPARPGRLVVVSLTTEPTFTFGNPVAVPVGRLQTGAVSNPNSPRRFDLGPDGAITGTVESEQTSSRLAAPRIEVVLNWFEELKARVPTR